MVRKCFPFIQTMILRPNAKHLPNGISYELSNFEQFMEERQKLMSDALKAILI